MGRVLAFPRLERLRFIADTRNLWAFCCEFPPLKTGL
jgi:hypothetical protein